MKITDVNVRFFGYRPSHPPVSSFASMARRTMCLVEVRAEDGTTGVGESWVNFPGWAPWERRATILAGLRPLVVGRDATDVAGTHRHIVQALERIALQWGAPGPIWQAISGVDLALWDLAGKARGLSVAEMLGSSTTTRVPIYASGLGPEVTEADVERQRDRGISVFKLKIGFGREQDLQQIGRLRELVGGDATVLVDANQAWDAQTAITMSRELERFGIAWLEEPVRADDLDVAVEVVAHSRVPIAAGENLYTRKSFMRWASQRGFNIAQPDVTKVGGLSEALVIAQMVQAWDLPYAPHFFGSAVGLIATAHLFAAVPGGLWVEFDSNPNPLREEVVAEGIVIENGHLVLPAGPGWGITLKEDTLAAYELNVDDAES